MLLMDCAGNEAGFPETCDRTVILPSSGSMMFIPPPLVPAHMRPSLSVKQSTTLLFSAEFEVLYECSSLFCWSYTSIPLLYRASQILPLESVMAAETSLLLPSELSLTSPVTGSIVMIPSSEEQSSFPESRRIMSLYPNGVVLSPAVKALIFPLAYS